jgi:hypothetical protein
MSYLEKLTLGKNQTSYKRRRLTLGPKDIQNGKLYFKLFREVSFTNDIYSLFGYKSTITKNIENLCLKKIHEAHLYHEDYHKILPKGTRVPVCKTIDDALKNCKTDEHAEFEHKFLFTVAEMKELSIKLFSCQTYALGSNRGKISNEELLLIVCARYRHVLATIQDIGDWFGRDKSFISSSFHLGVTIIDERFSSLLDLNNLPRWSNRVSSWNEAYEQKFFDRMGSSLPGRFADINCTLDGVRLYVAKPARDMMYLANPYCGNEANLLYLGIVAPNGIAIGLSQPYCGKNNDTGVALFENLDAKLTNANMIALCDSIFSHTLRIKPLPRKNQIHPFSGLTLKAISALRVSVEW